MVDPQLLAILCCPETKQDVKLLEGSVIAELNRLIEKGDIKTRAGEPVREKVDAVLVRDDKKFCYAIRDDIPIMLIDEAIPFTRFADQVS
jgi:uncharacterized protein YbaR (Trm112 family)